MLASTARAKRRARPALDAPLPWVWRGTPSSAERPVAVDGGFVFCSVSFTFLPFFGDLWYSCVGFLLRTRGTDPAGSPWIAPIELGQRIPLRGLLVGGGDSHAQALC